MLIDTVKLIVVCIKFYLLCWHYAWISSLMLLTSYYAQNYAGIIGSSLAMALWSPSFHQKGFTNVSFFSLFPLFTLFAGLRDPWIFWNTHLVHTLACLPIIAITHLFLDGFEPNLYFSCVCSARQATFSHLIVFETSCW